MWFLGVKESEYDVQMTIILVAEGYFWDPEVESNKRIKLSGIFLVVKSNFSKRRFMKMFSRNHHSYGYILQVVPNIICCHGLPIGVPNWPYAWYVWWKMSLIYITYVNYNFHIDIQHLNYLQTSQNVFETIVNIRGGHAPRHHDLHIRFKKMANCYGLSCKWEITWGTTGSSGIFLWIKYSDVSMAIAFIYKGVMK